MTNTEWNMGIEFLMSGEEGDWAENNGKTVEVTNMCGGRYLMRDEDGEVSGLTDDIVVAMLFLR